MDLILPYKIGDLAESKTFEEGYRGAWFRCKVRGLYLVSLLQVGLHLLNAIGAGEPTNRMLCAAICFRINDMRVAEGHLECYLEYIDYPAENNEWIRLFQKNPACSKQQSSDEIMIRPSFPQWHWKDKVPELLPNNEVIAIVDENWKVGDMVDWFSQGCYWSGKITSLLNKDMVRVKLLEPPIGEGKRYDANINDLRPNLDWSLTTDWTVPLSQARGKSWHVVRLIHHKSVELETSDSGQETPSDSGEEASSDSGEETSSSDGDKSDSDGGENVHHMISSNTSPRAPGYRNLPSSVAKSMSSLNTPKDDTLRSMAYLKTSSNSREPSDGVQPAVTSSQPGIVVIEQERGMGNSKEQDQAGNIQDQYLQNLAKGDGNRKELMERTRLMERKTALLSFLLALDDDSVKTK